MESLNNRELSLITWVVFVFVFFFLKHPSQSKDLFKSVLKAIFSRHILFSLTLMAGYVGLFVYFLFLYEIWETKHLKSTIIWFIFSGIVLFKNTIQAKDSYKFLMQTVKGSITVAVILEFIIGIESFSFITELLLLPFLVILYSLSYQAKSMKDVILVHKFIDIMIVVIFFILLINAINNLFIKSIDLTSVEIIKDFSMPIILSLCLIPFLAFMSIYSVYQYEFVRLRFRIRNSKLRFLAKLYTFAAFNVRLKLFRRWSRLHNIDDIQNHHDLIESIKEIFRIIKLENSPRCLPNQDNWSPFHAAEFLDNIGLNAGNYNRQDDGVWFSCSDFVEFGDGFPQNNMRYYITGERELAKKLLLKMNVNQLEYLDSAIDRMLNAIDLLVNKACESGCPEVVKLNVKTLTDYETECNSVRINFSVEKWDNNLSKGLSMSLELFN